MQAYKSRKIAFRELLQVGEWKVKVYTITKMDTFHPTFYKSVLAQLPEWLAMKNSFDASHDNIAFLILHAGTEGIFSLINWWVGKNMLNTHIFMTNPKESTQFQKISGDGLAPCIWELEIINHERRSWTANILKQHHDPDWKAYLEDLISVEV
ncbi:MAG: hypothetical protein AAF789_13745 [Bacteroidota bacterium]